ncbi:MAG: ferritin [Lentisphaeria bacterium]
MLKQVVKEALCNQIQKETFSSYRYLAMSFHATAMGFAGAAKWFMIQANEEMEHAKKFWDYLQKQDEEVILQAIPAPEVKQNSLLELFEAALEHEKYVTNSINKLVEICANNEDYATGNFLTWFVDEQVEEEHNCITIIKTLKLLSSPASIYMYDRQLGKRGED